ncbi:MAG: UPF0182 family protein, partial [Actinobacteria bacterium]|nr:UPF0182 family protein [Actinomycetota bacterium]
MTGPDTGPGGDVGGPGREQPPRNLFEALMMGYRFLSDRQQGQHAGTGHKGRGAGRGATRRTIILIVLAVALIVLLGLLSTVASAWTSLLWFGELGFSGVFWTRTLAPLALAAVGGVVFLAIFFGNTYLARRLSPRIRMAGRQGDNDVLELVPLSDRAAGRWLLGISLFLAFFFALGAGNAWQQVLLFANRVSFGYQDPIFHKDASFYVFVLPLARTVLNFLWISVILTLIGTVGVYVFDRAIFAGSNRRLTLAPHVKAHLSWLAVLLLVLKAISYWLKTYELNFSTRGVVFGASYTDVHAELPVLRILAIAALVSAVIFLANIYVRGWRLPAVAVGLIVVVWLVAGQIYPAIVQQYRVSPNELQAESSYIKKNITSTRWAFGLDKVTSRPFPAAQALTSTDIRTNAATVDNIRLWDPRPLLATFEQLQTLQLQYTFKDVDVERYTIDGAYRQVMLSVRELDQNQLPSQARTWLNQHLVYTHGYGAVVSAVNQATPEGLPVFIVKDIPPTGASDLKIKRPEIYYGEVGNDYVLVKTKQQEFDYPKGDANVYATYQGSGGVGVGSFVRQAAFALRFGTLKLLLSQYVTPDSKLMFRRTITERVDEVAPFLSYDGDPYMIVRDDGTLAWVWDAYTSTDHFPYSQPRSDGTNYIRNSIKVVVDAYNGKVTLYQIDEKDALATAWGKVFPGLITPGSKMPEDIRRNLRYPEDLFSLQAQVLATYHMTDPQVFYNKQDMWEIPKEIVSGGQQQPLVPYYVIMSLPGEPKEEFLLLQPFSPLKKQNMSAWLAARMDAGHYGELVTYDFPKDKIVYGPAQIETFISQDPLISGQLTLWDQAGSSVIRGNLLVIPIEDAVLYAEPLYLQADQSSIPSLKRVIV